MARIGLVNMPSRQTDDDRRPAVTCQAGLGLVRGHGACHQLLTLRWHYCHYLPSTVRKKKSVASKTDAVTTGLITTLDLQSAATAIKSAGICSKATRPS